MPHVECGCCGTAADPAQARLAAAQERSVALTARAAAAQTAHGGNRPGTPAAATDVTDEIVTALATVSSLQAMPRMAMSAAALPGGSRPDLVCTLDGGQDAMRARVDEWASVVERATGREPADGGVTLVYDHDPAVTVELARLAAAEFACCSFFAFTLSVAPAGLRFTITAPDEAHDVVTAMFGTAA